jgi:hypothetical protein
MAVTELQLLSMHSQTNSTVLASTLLMLTETRAGCSGVTS